jgi:hypothetical protein
LPFLEHDKDSATPAKRGTSFGEKPGGYSTKMHSSVDLAGESARIENNWRSKSDMTQGEEWIESWQKEDTKVQSIYQLKDTKSLHHSQGSE